MRLNPVRHRDGWRPIPSFAWVAGLLWLAVDPAGAAGFRRMPPEETGIRFTNRLAEAAGLTNTILNNGSGVACGDIDGDGLADLHFCGLEGGNVLYRNRGGWRFTDITAAAGVTVTNQASTGSVLADVDGDGDLDLLVGGIGVGVRLWINDGRGRFAERADAGFIRRHAAMSMALADTDGDGDLDLYVANYRTTTILDQPGVRFAVRQVGGGLTVTRVDGIAAEGPEWEGRFGVGPGGALRETGEPDVFYRNNGAGRFTPVPWTDGTFRDDEGRPLREPPRDWGLSAMFRDMDGDSAPDLYVCNDADSPDRFWLNDGRGGFRMAPAWALRHTSLSSMGIDVADVNRDGHDDLFVLDMLARRPEKRLTQLEKSRPPMADPADDAARPQVPRNTLQVARGDGTYAELASMAGLAAADWGWCPVFLDVDLDGFEDLLVANGFHREVEDIDVADRIRAAKAGRRMSAREELGMRAWYPRWETANAAFRNRGDLRFEDAAKSWGFDTVGVSQGMALADLDGDGDLDVVINNLNGAAGLYRNEATAPRLAVRLRGRGGNTQGIGARVRVLGGAVPEQRQEIIAGGRYLSGDEAMRVFAAGTATNRLTLEVRWRSGTFSVVTNVAPDRICTVTEDAAGIPGLMEPGSLSLASIAFEDVSALLAHRHQARPSHDPGRQPLLPRPLRPMGPALAWCDIDGNGSDDLLIGASAGDPLAVRVNAGPDGFRAVDLAPIDPAPAPNGDLAGILGWSSEPGHATLLLGLGLGLGDSANAQTGPAVLRRDLFFGQAETTVAVPGADTHTVGPLAVSDIDGDGDLDLFVGGRAIPGRYPLPADSRVLRSVAGRLVPDEADDAVLRGVGLVRGAVWSDLTGDGFPELVLACEWGPMKVFRNTGGRLSSWDPAVTWRDDAQVTCLSELGGWWTGVTAGDFDGDGRLDLVAGNWGHNSRYEEYLAGELRIWHGDMDANGTWEAVETLWDPVLGMELPWIDRNVLGAAVPVLSDQFPTHAAYAGAGWPAMVGGDASRLTSLRARVLDSVVFLNRGDRFEARPLPAEAQWAPAFAVCVGDADGDGGEDLFLGQNFFADAGHHGRLDAGRGLWLAGNGRGGFTPVPGHRSGVRVYGEQRGAALADFDRDARVDLAVTQAGGETKLYRNRQARPGLRVRLAGPGANVPGFGAVVQVGMGHAWGPAREIHGGSGYLSQDSPVVVMARPAGTDAVRIRVRWPGGAVTTATVPPGALEVVVHANATSVPANP